MRNVLLLAAILASVSANGYYYQESSSRSSSSSYKNNELQHQTEDESYYAKQGDTEHKTKPKVNTYAHHIQYNNPHNQDHMRTGVSPGDSDAYAARQAVGSDGVVKTVTGNRDHYSYQATYGVSGGQINPLQGGQYDTQSNLLSLTQRLQNDLSRQLQNAIATQKQYSSSYSGSSTTYVESDFRGLENELKANLTRQLDEELRRQYGTQVNRGSHSYTVTDGRYTSQANYNTQELNDLTQQLQRNLMQQLRNQYQNTAPSASGTDSYYSASQQQHKQHSEQSSRAHSTMYRPTYEQFPQNPEVRPAVPLNQVVTQVQATADRKLNEALDFAEQTYVTGDVTYTGDSPDFHRILEDLKQELLRNITTILQTTLMEQYGTQEEHNNYYYSSRNVASGSMVANYRLDDLNSLKQQVENNLLEKLRNSVQRQEQTYSNNRQSYYQRQSYSSSSSYGSSSYRPSSPKVYTSYVAFTPQRGTDDTYRQTQTHSSDNTYGRHDEQVNTRPAYRPVYTTDERPERYGGYPSQQTTHQTAGHAQDSQRTEQLEYAYNPTGTRPTTSRVTYRPSGSGSYQTGTVYYPSGSATYPSGGGTSYQTTNRESSHQSVTGNRGTQYAPTQQDFQAELLDIKDQVQTDISRQINTAIDRQRHSGTAYSTTMTSNEVLTHLSDELKRNLTRKIEETLRDHQRRTGVTGGYTVTVNTGGRIHPGSYSREQLATLTSELQEDLLRQLRQGLAQESHQSHSGTYNQGGGYAGGSRAYSSYSSGSSYRTYGSSGGTVQGECCIQGDDSTTIAQEEQSEEISGKKEPNRGDIAEEDSQKIEDNKSPVAIEANPPEVVETSTRKLARDKPSRKPITWSTTPRTVAKPIRQDETEQNADDDQQLTENLDQFSQSYLDQHDVENQFTEQDQQNQETTDEQFHEQSSGFSQQTINHFDQQSSQESEGQTINTGSVAQQSQNSAFGGSTDATQEVRRYSGRLRPVVIPPYGAARKPQSEIERQNRLAQQTEDLAQQTRYYSMQGQHMTQQTEDLSQKTQDVDVLNQQNQFLTHERDIPQRYRTQVASQTIGQTTSHQHQTQQTEDLTQETEDLTQQTEDLTQHTEDLAQQLEDLTQQTYLPGQHTQDLTQQTEDLTQHLTQQSHVPAQHTQDLTQQTEDLTQHVQDLTQQTEDLTQHLTQQSYVPDQHTQDLTQQTEDLTQHTQQTEDLSQHTQHITQQSYVPAQHTQDLTQQTEDLTQQHLGRQTAEQRSAYLLQQLGGLVQNGEAQQIESDTHKPPRYQNGQTHQQTVDEQLNTHHQQPNRGYYGNYRSQSSHSSSSSSSSSSANSQQVQYSHIGEIPLEKATDLEQQHVEQQHANVVQDVSQQARDGSQTVLEDVEQITTEKPGFWKKLGGKITKSYNKAKDSILSVG